MGLKISRILHAGYVFECGQTKIAFDPIFENPFSQNCYAFPNVQFDHEQIKNLKFAAVFISHYHDDHCSLESLNFLDRETPIYIYCLFDELLSMIRELGFQHVYSLELNIPVKIDPIEIVPLRALDSEVDSIFHIKADGLNVLNVVDSWIDPLTMEKLIQNAPWDLVLWPFQTMREIEVLSPSRALPAPANLPVEWIEQLKLLNPRYIAPSSCQFVLESWSWYNQAFFPISYQQFKNEIKSVLPNSQVVRLNPSVSVLLDQKSLTVAPALSWALPIGDQELDYEFNHQLKPPSTAEIARHFQPLTAVQTEKVFLYCTQGLIEKYHSMESPTDSYFEKSRLWRLSLYDHQGKATDFFYRVLAGRIERDTQGNGPLGWTTEIPIFKFFAALEWGEALTSLYIRINDVVFEPQIEREIQSADILEDPVIRCLYTGAFGAYQAAQLERLKLR